MNIIALIILIALLFDSVLNGLADYLNLTRLQEDLPEAFEDVYDPERYRKSQEYLKVNTRFGWMIAAFDLIVILVFWFVFSIGFKRG